MHNKLSIYHYGLSVLAVVLVVFGVRCIYLWDSISCVPFWDQWFGEFETIIVPDLKHELSFSNFFIGHNEHRLLTTKICSYLFYKIQGKWDVRSLIVLSSLVASVNVGLIYYFVVPKNGNVSSWLNIGYLMVTLTLFGFPVDVFGLLSGFQIQFHLLVLFSLFAYAIISRDRMRITEVFTCALLLLLGLLSSAGGYISMLVCLVVVILQQLSRRQCDRNRIILSVLILSLIIFSVWADSVTSTSGHIEKFVRFWPILIKCLSWPFNSNPFFALLFLGSLIGVLCKSMFFDRENDNRTWILLSLGGWVVGISLSVSYTRGSFCKYSDFGPERYLAIISFAPLVVFYFMECLCKCASGWKRIMANILLITCGLTIITLVKLEFGRTAIPKINAHIAANSMAENRFKYAIEKNDWNGFIGQYVFVIDHFSVENYSLMENPVFAKSIPWNSMQYMNENPEIAVDLFSHFVDRKQNKESSIEPVIWILGVGRFLVLVGALVLILIWMGSGKKKNSRSLHDIQKNEVNSIN